jgi:DNA gyrase inhibitor GyrI
MDRRRSEDGMRVKIQELPSYTVACVAARSTQPVDVAEAWKKLITWLGSERALSETAVGGGIGIFKGTVGSKSFGYEAAWPLEDEVPTGRGIKLSETAAGTYAVARVKGDLSRLEDTISYLLEEWLPESGFRRRNAPILALHRNSLKKRSRHEQVVDLCLPIADAGEAASRSKKSGKSASAPKSATRGAAGRSKRTEKPTKTKSPGKSKG